jgi:hypothetical protein
MSPAVTSAMGAPRKAPAKLAALEPLAQRSKRDQHQPDAPADAPNTSDSSRL